MGNEPASLERKTEIRRRHTVPRIECRGTGKTVKGNIQLNRRKKGTVVLEPFCPGQLFRIERPRPVFIGKTAASDPQLGHGISIFLAQGKCILRTRQAKKRGVPPLFALPLMFLYSTHLRGSTCTIKLSSPVQILRLFRRTSVSAVYRTGSSLYPPPYTYHRS